MEGEEDASLTRDTPEWVFKQVSTNTSCAHPDVCVFQVTGSRDGHRRWPESFVFYVHR